MFIGQKKTMIKFFRHIRRSLINQNQMGKYFKYAIGEILLVVIGILIALQINNWNEDRKEQEKLNTIYGLIVSDLESDLKTIPKVLKYYNDKSPLLKDVIDGYLSQNDYISDSRYYTLIGGGQEYELRTKGYEQLRNFNGSDFSSDELQIKINDFYEKQNSDLETFNELILEDLSSNYDYWKENFSWYSDFLIKKKSEGFIKYATKSMDYKNRVANYYFLNCNLFSEVLREIEIEARKILSLLKEKINDQILP